MNTGADRPRMQLILTGLLGVLFSSLALPAGWFGGYAAAFYAAAQGVGWAAAALIAVSVARNSPGEHGRTADDPGVNLAACAAAVLLIQAFFRFQPLLPLLFFVGYPFTLFARRRGLLWVPAGALAVAAAGRYFFLADLSLAVWAAVFLFFSIAVGLKISGDAVTIGHLRSQIRRINSDAREMMERIRRDRFPATLDRIRGEDAARAIALDEDDLLQRLLRWGCRVFNARTGILLVPDEPGFFRMRAAVHRGVRILEGLVPADKGFVHITAERGGTLCVSDATSAGRSLSFYPEETRVGSFLVKIVYDPRWAEDAGDGKASGKVRCILYFDSDEVGAMSLEDATVRRLDEFGGLIHKTMDTAGHLQKLTTELSSKDAISRYARGLTRSLEPEFIAEIALDAVVEAVPHCEGAVVMLYEDGLTPVAARGDAVAGLGRERILREESSQMGLLLRRFTEVDAGSSDGNAPGAEIVINSEQARKSPFFRKGESLGKVVSFAAIPCFMERGASPLKAAIAVVSRKPGAFKGEVVEDLRTIAGMMAPALDNALTHREKDELARTDGLTGLLNHRTFQVVFDGKLSHLNRGTFRSLAVIMVDGDRFKDVNDSHGHAVGDEVLVELARRLKMGTRKNDAVARYGGEEFAIILDNAGEKQAREVAEKMRQSIRSRPFVTAAGPLRVTASFGYSVMTTAESVSKKELLERADQALYGAKSAGRDRVVSYLDLGEERARGGGAPDGPGRKGRSSAVEGGRTGTG